MVTGMDLLVDRLFALLYHYAGQGFPAVWNRKRLLEELGCSYSPTFRQAIEWAKQSGLVTQTEAFERGRKKVFYCLTDEAIEAAAADKAENDATR